MESKINSNFLSFGNLFEPFDEQVKRHRWYSYKESFPSSFVENAFTNSNLEKNAIILDIFNGGGTVTLAASLKGFNSIRLEVNPFSAFISKTKLINCSLKEFDIAKSICLNGLTHKHKSPLLGFSTFSEKTKRQKWLFNSSVLNAFEACWISTASINKNIKPLFELSLLNGIMDNCNAVKDGKCLKYRDNWENLNFSKNTFLESLQKHLNIIEEDLKIKVRKKSKIINCDTREFLQKGSFESFDLCLSSPPYLNSFDYTDIYRPELFLGKFIKNSQQLQSLRLKTLRSHVEIKLPRPFDSDFGILYSDIFQKISNKKNMLWDKQIPIMIQGYFEDIKNTLINLKKYSKINSQVWLVVSNSAYVGVEIPVDLIIAEIGCKIGWKLKEIGVLKYIPKRVSKYSPEIKNLRESVVIFNR